MVNMLTTSNKTNIIILYLSHYFLILLFKNARSTYGKISFDQCAFKNCFALFFSSLMDLKYICYTVNSPLTNTSLDGQPSGVDPCHCPVIWLQLCSNNDIIIILLLLLLLLLLSSLLLSLSLSLSLKLLNILIVIILSSFSIILLFITIIIIVIFIIVLQSW